MLRSGDSNEISMIVDTKTILAHLLPDHQRPLKMDMQSPISILTPADLGRAIRARRLELGLQQAEVAMQSGVSTPTVSAIENGKETARIGLVLRICHDLGIRIRLET